LWQGFFSPAGAWLLLLGCWGADGDRWRLAIAGWLASPRTQRAPASQPRPPGSGRPHSSQSSKDGRLGGGGGAARRRRRGRRGRPHRPPKPMGGRRPPPPPPARADCLPAPTERAAR
jgi:hypothetical protein